ncbi:MAG TPA: DUF3050 domain-containing protein [Solirubrobacteraceae bacterium]|nr:DUF3050 domain-containing protein [Solirubrobacteraceae bacterium]
MTDSARERVVSIETARERLVRHPLYDHLDGSHHIRVFMKHHVFAVWDFFSLLKRLQTEVTCVTVPWRPRGLGDHARFITEIVIAEECDEGIGGGHLSHFELYLLAMDEMGADRRPINGFMSRLSAGQDVFEALASPDIPATAQEFVSHTLQVALEGAPHEVAASFCHGRENLLPDVLGGARDGMSQVLAQAPVFKHYLERHITLDHDEHGPLALRLLAALCDGEEKRLAQADRVAVEAIEARGRLWDGVLDELQRTSA